MSKEKTTKKETPQVEVVETKAVAEEKKTSNPEMLDTDPGDKQTEEVSGNSIFDRVKDTVKTVLEETKEAVGDIKDVIEDAVEDIKFRVEKEKFIRAIDNAIEAGTDWDEKDARIFSTHYIGMLKKIKSEVENIN